MAHTFSKNYVHVIFSTKDRRKIIKKELQPRLWAYLAGIGKNYDMKILAVGGTEFIFLRNFPWPRPWFS